MMKLADYLDIIGFPVIKMLKIKNDYPDGLYNFFAGKKFKENLGEYYQGTDSTKIKKRVITYTII